MLTVVASLFSLLLGTAVLLVGVGLLGTLLGVRAGLEHFGAAITGAIMSAYFSGYVVGTFLIPRLIRRVGHIRAFAAMAAVAAATAITHAMVIDPWAWMGLRAITGICLVGLYMVIESWLNALAPNQHRGQVFALYMTVVLISMALGQFLILAGDVGGFDLFGLTTILLALALVPIVLTQTAQPAPVQTPRVGLRQLFSVSPLGVAGAFVTGTANSAFWGMGAVFASGIGFDEPRIAAYMSATILGGALLQWPIGRLSDRYDRRTVLTVLCLAAVGAGLGAFFLASRSQLGLLACTFVYGGLAFSAYSLSVAHVNDHLEPSAVLEAASGLLLVYGVGAAAGPFVVGIAMELFGPRSLLAYFVVSFALLALFALYRMRVAAPIPIADQGAFLPVVRTTPVVLEIHPQTEIEPELDLESQAGRGDAS